MTLQTLKIGKREFVLLAKRDFDKLAAQAQRQTEDDHWTEAALQAEAKARRKRRSPSPSQTSSASWTRAGAHAAGRGDDEPQGTRACPQFIRYA